MTKQSFRDATKLKNIWNKTVAWNNMTFALVGWHSDQWKHVENGTDFDTICEDNYIPIAQFHKQEELWQYIKKNSLDITK